MLVENYIKAFFTDLVWDRVKEAVLPTRERGGVRFGLLRDNELGSVEDVVDIVAHYDARLMSLRTSQSSERISIYVALSDVDRKALGLREDLERLGEILYFQSIE